MLVSGPGHGRQSNQAARTEEDLALAPAADTHGGRWQRSGRSSCRASRSCRSFPLSRRAGIACKEGSWASTRSSRSRRSRRWAGTGCTGRVARSGADGEGSDARRRACLRRTMRSRHSRGRGTDCTPRRPGAGLPGRASAGEAPAVEGLATVPAPSALDARRAVVACRPSGTHDHRRPRDRGRRVRPRRGSCSIREDGHRSRYERRGNRHTDHPGPSGHRFSVAAPVGLWAIRRRSARRGARCRTGRARPFWTPALRRGASRPSVAAPQLRQPPRTRTIDQASASAIGAIRRPATKPTVGWSVLVAHSQAPRSSPARTAVAPSGRSGIPSEASGRRGRLRG